MIQSTNTDKVVMPITFKLAKNFRDNCFSQSVIHGNNDRNKPH